MQKLICFMGFLFCTSLALAQGGKGCGGLFSKIDNPKHLLLSEEELHDIAVEMQGLPITPEVTHRWRNSGSGDAFMHARENPLAHWLATRLILKRLQSLYGSLSAEEMLDQGVALPFFDQDFSDVVIGDGHMGNIGLIPLVGSQYRADSPKVKTIDIYKYQIRIVFNDVDDAGFGPLMGDFLRNAATSALMGADVQELARSYYAGLTHISPQYPKWVQPYAEMSVEDFEKLQVAHVKKALKNGEFESKSGEIGYMISDQLISLFRSIFPDVHHEANKPMIATFTKKSGGSGGVLRYWILRELSDEQKIISEVKWITDQPGVMGYNPDQLLPLQRVEVGFARMWGGERNHEIRGIQLDKNSFYFVRPRYDNPVKDYVDDLKPGSPDVQEWASFSAALLGEVHDLSPARADEKFAEMIQKNPEAFLRASLQMVSMINEVFAYARDHY